MKPRITRRAHMDVLPGNGPFERAPPPCNTRAPVTDTKTACFPREHAQKCGHMANFTYSRDQYHR